MESLVLSNPIYQHSGETEKSSAIAQQATVNEDQEQRRRQLDRTGEQHKVLLAKEVSHLVDQFGGNVHLKNTPYTPHKQPILQQAQQGASHVLSSALEAGKNLINSASAAAGAVAGAAAGAVQTVANTALDTATSALGTATAVGHDAADKMGTVAHEAAHQASNIAGAVSKKTKKFASVASDKAHEIADNISHFTTLVGVLAEEENERARRMVSGDEARAAANAFRVSELIRDLGDSFYKQTPNLLYTTKVLEEAERRWRLSSSASELAESNAHREGKLVRNNLQSFMPRYQWVRSHINTLEEKERTRRLNDPAEAYAIMNALNLSFIIRELGLAFYRQEGTFSLTHAGYATTLLEENERRERIRTDKFLHPADSHHLLMDVVSNNIEKLSYSTRNAAKFANAFLSIKSKFLAHLNRAVHGAPNFQWKHGIITEFATLLGNATMKVASQFSSMTKDFAGAAAERVKTVAVDIRNFTATMYVVALEEKERARRLSDPDEVSAINNAWFQSQLIRDLSALYKPTAWARYPLGLIEESERRWRMSSVTPSASHKISALVLANRQQFALATQRAADLESARADAIAHSRLNPRAPAFVPHQSLPAKPEPAPVQRTNIAAGAQL
jgi:hypothetical protein